MSDIKEPFVNIDTEETPGSTSTPTPEPEITETAPEPQFTEAVPENPKPKKKDVKGYEIVPALQPLIVYNAESAFVTAIGGIVAVAFLTRITKDIVETRHLLTLGKHILGLWIAGKVITKHARKGFQPPREEEEIKCSKQGSFEKSNFKIDVHLNFSDLK